jgi:hypothetical protein
MKYSTYFPSPYLKASDLDTERQRVTIAKLEEESMGYPRERKLVMHFEELEQRFVLGPGNGKTLRRLFGNDTEGSIGKVVDLVVKSDVVDGKRIEFIVIEIPAEQPPSPLAGETDHVATSATQSDDDDIRF